MRRIAPATHPVVQGDHTTSRAAKMSSNGLFLKKGSSSFHLLAFKSRKQIRSERTLEGKVRYNPEAFEIGMDCVHETEKVQDGPHAS